MSSADPSAFRDALTMRAMPRRLSRPRPAQGAKLLALRRAAGLSQAELAAAVGENTRNIAYWEASTHPPRSDVLPKLARVLNCTVEDLLSVRPPASHKPGPVSRLQRLVEQLSNLPKRQQERIVDVLEALIEKTA